MELSSSGLETSFKIPFENIYKVHILDDHGKIARVHIFCANTIDESMLSNVFSELQIAYYSQQNVEFVFSPLLIHKDDTIRTIKRKILQDVEEYYNQEKKEDFSSAPEELYLFSEKSFDISASDLFQEITQGKRNTITKESFYHYASILNLKPNLSETANLVNKTEYTWNDWNAICNKKSTNLFIPIGMNFQKRQDKLFPTNPFHEQFSTIPVRYHFKQGNSLISLEKSLLLNYAPNETNIMACFAKDVFQYAITNEISQNYMCQLYFPQLHHFLY